MANFFDNAASFLFSSLKQPIETFIRLETADDKVTLVAEDGSLVSFLRIDGCRQIVGDSEYNWMIEQSTIKLGSRFDRPGHALQVYFMRNPDRASMQLGTLLKPSQATAGAIGLDLADLFEERQRHLSRYLATEEIYFVLWTRPSVLPKSEMQRAAKDLKDKKWVKAPNAQRPFQALTALRTRHRSYMLSMTSSLEEIGLRCNVTEVHDALRAIRGSLYPNRMHDQWQPCLPGDPVPARELQREKDLSDVLWPPLRRQLAIDNAKQISDKIVQIGDQIWGPIDMSLGPMDPNPFPQLLARLAEMDVPFRVSFLIEGGGIQGAALRRALSSVLAVTSETNKQIRDSLAVLQKLSQSEPVVRMRVNFCTWAPKDNLKLLEDRLSILTQAAESWGYTQVTQLTGDPLEAVLSSALGISCSSTAAPAVVPLFEAMKLLPWQRASSPFTKGSIMFRTLDGRVWPYQTGSNLTTTWFDLIFAQPGAGKSVLMNALNLGTCLSPGNSNLPFIAIVDIGPSSSGLISLLKDALPAERRHEVAHYRMRLTPDYAVNPFDTQLGCRAPLPDERSYLIELLTLLSTAPGQAVPYDGIAQLAGFVVDEMYRWRDDNTTNAEPRQYLQRMVPEVDKAIADYNIELPPESYWWDVVDKLFERGLIHEANLAQRHASPTLTDAVTASRRPQIRALLEETNVGSGTEGVIHAFERMMSSAIREFPILSSITRFDISDTRICSLDLAEVAPQGDETADRQTAIMYMLARHVLVRNWWLSEDAVKTMPQKYRAHHEKRLSAIRETPKRLCYDEFHRTSRSKAVRSQVVRDVREGRKWGVQIILASQLLDDFDNDMVDLATGVWILGGAVSDRVVNYATERFGLSDTAKWVMRYRLTGPRASGAPALLVLGTNEGRYEQHLVNTLGPIELWALNTSSEDVSLRRRLYDRAGRETGAEIAGHQLPVRIGAVRNYTPRNGSCRFRRGCQRRDIRRGRPDRGRDDRCRYDKTAATDCGGRAASSKPDRSIRRARFTHEQGTPEWLTRPRIRSRLYGRHC